MGKTLIIVLLTLVFAVGLGLGYYFGYDVGFERAAGNGNAGKSAEIASFAECIAAGNPVMESYPRQCRANGLTFTEEIGNELELTDTIVVTNPRPNQEITSPLNVEGRARGTWFFEANAPLKLVDSDGNELAQGYIESIGEWMTEDFVEFRGEIIFTPGNSKSGNLIFEKANPSGLPENAEELRMPVEFE